MWLSFSRGPAFQQLATTCPLSQLPATLSGCVSLQQQGSPLQVEAGWVGFGFTWRVHCLNTDVSGNCSIHESLVEMQWVAQKEASEGEGLGRPKSGSSPREGN